MVLVLAQGLFTEGGGGAVGPYSMLNITGTYKGELCSLSPCHLVAALSLLQSKSVYQNSNAPTPCALHFVKETANYIY